MDNRKIILSCRGKWFNFGYFGYLVSRGILKKSFSSLFVSLITVFAYGGLIWGLLPTYSRISWEGHLCGFVAGILAARFERSGD